MRINEDSSSVDEAFLQCTQLNALQKANSTLIAELKNGSAGRALATTSMKTP
jgi:hypothetical protein